MTVAVDLAVDAGALVAIDDALRLRVRPLGRRGLSPDGQHVLEESRLLVEAEDLDGEGPPSIEIHGLEGIGEPDAVDNRTAVEVNTGSALGTIPIRVSRGGRSILASIEVRPYKLDYQSHYVEMRDQLEELAHNLLLHAWQAAARKRGLQIAEEPTPAELIALLGELWERLRRLFSTIEADPHREVVSAFEVSDLSRARDIRQESIVDLVRHPSHWLTHPQSRPPLPATQSIGGALFTPIKVLEHLAELTYDTAPNRVLAHMLRKLLGAVHEARRITVEDIASDYFPLQAKPSYLRFLGRLAAGIGAIVRTDFLAEAGAVRPGDFSEHILEADPRYRALMDLLRLLHLGISPRIEGRAFAVSEREVWEIFEYWIYLSVTAELLTRDWDALDADTLFRTSDEGLVLGLARGTTATVTFVKDGDRLELTYQRRYVSGRVLAAGTLHTRTHDMQPDIVIRTVDPAGVERIAVIDAKYRLDTDAIGPPQSSIDALHVYHDGIGRTLPTGAFLPAVTMAIAAFPAPSVEEFNGHRYERSLRFGVGGLPFLPGQHGAARALALIGA